MTTTGDSGFVRASSQVFMLRFWSENLGDGYVDWRGRVQHINSGEVSYFRDWDILEKFIQEFLGGFPMVLDQAEGKPDPSGKPPIIQS